MTLKYAVIGHPIAHSKSPMIHAAFAQQCGISLSYERVLSPLEGFEESVRQLVAKGFSGANVTVPFKFEAFALCDALSGQAKAAKAVNTLTFKQGQLQGDNTDGMGLLRDITENLQVSVSHKKVLLMGAGGAAYGVVLPLLQAGADLYVANRTPEKAIALAQWFNALGGFPAMHAGGYEAVQKICFDVVINATSSGLGDEAPPLSRDNITSKTLAYDMMYGKETLFLQQASRWQAQVADGLGMLVEQAAEAFWLWHGVRPSTAPVIEAMRNA